MSEPTTPTRELLVRYQAIFQAALSLLRAINTGLLSKGELLAHIPRGLQAQNVPNGITEQLASEWQDIRAKLSKLDAEIARRKAEIATVQESIANLDIGFVNAGQKAEVKLGRFHTPSTARCRPR